MCEIAYRKQPATSSPDHHLKGVYLQRRDWHLIIWQVYFPSLLRCKGEDGTVSCGRTYCDLLLVELIVQLLSPAASSSQSDSSSEKN